ncbi:MAG: hypothetical protein RL095_1204 [Verrucomicrobiota bacterium]
MSAPAPELRVQTRAAAAAFFVLALLAASMARWSGNTAAILSLAPSIAALVFGLLAMRSASAAWLLEEERRAAARRQRSAEADLFLEDAGVLSAERESRSLHRWIIPAAGLVVAIGLGAAAWHGFFPGVDQATAVKAAGNALLKETGIVLEGVNPVRCGALLAALAVAQLLAGAFFAGLGRSGGSRELGAAAAWCLAAAAFGGANAAALILSTQGVDIHQPLRLVLAGVLSVLALEIPVTLMIEYFRPRRGGEQLVLSSRLLSLFTEPGTVAANLGKALEYQFGVKVEEGSTRRFFTRLALPLILLQLLAFWMLDGFARIEPGQQGIRETFGKRSQQTLEPGLHFKLPWPFGAIRVENVESVKVIVLGTVNADKQDSPPSPEEDGYRIEEGKVMVWGRPSHGQGEGKEDFNYPMPSKANSKDINLVSVKIPLHYRIADLHHYLYNHRDAAATLEKLAERCVSARLANRDAEDLLGADRKAESQVLQALIQKEADVLRLGVEIHYVSIETIHPPVKAAAAFGEVMGARFDKDAKVYKASADAKKLSTEALSETFAIESKALAAASQRGAIASEQAARFAVRKTLHDIDPCTFRLLSYLEVIQGLKDLPKYIVCGEQAKRVINLNLERDANLDLLKDIQLESAKPAADKENNK